MSDVGPDASAGDPDPATTRLCPECGAEYLAVVQMCADCLVPLLEPGVELVDETEFELSDWPADLRGRLVAELERREISFEWEGNTLVVEDGDADTVEGIVDAVEEEAGIGGDDEGEDLGEDIPEAEEGYDEAVMETVGALFVAADRLMHDPDDARLAGDLIAAAVSVEGAGVPFGFPPRDWQRVVALAGSIRDALEADTDDEVVSREARGLRDLLRGYV
jgi:hypothetical protein